MMAATYVSVKNAHGDNAAKFYADMCCEIKNIIKSKMDAAAFDSWIAPLSFEIIDGLLQIVAPNRFSSDFIQRTYINIIKSVAEKFSLSASVSFGPVNSVSDTCVNDNAAAKFEMAEKDCGAVTTGFDNFIASEENAFVVSALKKMVLGRVSFSPLFIYGAPGCGKSLLLRALEHTATGRVLAMTGTQFLSEFQRAILERATFSFKDFVRNCDTFILDDVQELMGKRATSEEFFALLSDLVREGKNIVISANGSPSSLSGFDRRMQSVLASGLSIELSTPDESVRRAMLIRGGLPVDIANSISKNIPANGHIISGIIKKVGAWSELMGETLTVAVCDRLLSDVVSAQKTPLQCAREMALQLGVSFEDISSSSRSRAVVRCRQIMFAALKSATKLSLSEIGQLVGGRDHATVLYGLAQIEKNKKSDLVLSAEIAQMIELCK